MPVKKSTLTRFKHFRNVAKPEFRSHIDQVIKLYENRNISKEKTAENLLRRLVGPKPQAAVKELVTKHAKNPS